MTRVHSHATAAQAIRTRGKVPKSRIRKHKIVLESITQEKKKLRSVISFESKAPPGYTFIPAGNPQFTVGCKELCRKDGLKVYTVSTTPHQRNHNLSQHVHRIGYHFPSVVVATICMERGLYLSSTGRVVAYQQTPTRNILRERKTSSELSQHTINIEASDAIKDLFPNIPANDLNQIIKTAFQKGKRKVGTAVELPLARRVQLAVVAHIRHVYTDYDRLLKMTSFQEARAAVEEPCLAKLVQWRGDDENGTTVLEDVFREVVVISDDEDDTERSEKGRTASVEILSNNTVMGDFQTNPVNYETSIVDPSAICEFSEDEPPAGFRYVSISPPKQRTADRNDVDRGAFSRYQAWDRARNRYRNAVGKHNPTHVPEQPVAQYHHPNRVSKPLLKPSNVRNPHIREISNPKPMNTIHPEDQVEGRYRDTPLVNRPSTRFIEPNEHETLPKYSGPPNTIRFPSGAVFERAEVPFESHERRTDPRLKPMPITRPFHKHVPYEQGQYESVSNTFRQPQHIASSGDHVFTSIESPVSSTLIHNDARHREANGRPSHRPFHTPRLVNHPPAGVTNINIGDEGHHFPHKRSKVIHSPPQRRQDALRYLYPSELRRSPRNFENSYSLDGHRSSILDNKTNNYLDSYPQQLHNTPTLVNPQPQHSFPRPDADYVAHEQLEFGERSSASAWHSVSHQRDTARNQPPPSHYFLASPNSSSSMLRNDDRNVNPNPISYTSRHTPVQLEAGKAQVIHSNRPPLSRVSMRPSSPDRRLYSSSDARMSNIYSHDFVRHVHLHEDATVPPQLNSKPPPPFTRPGPVHRIPEVTDRDIFRAPGKYASASDSYRSHPSRIHYLDSHAYREKTPQIRRSPPSLFSKPQSHAIIHTSDDTPWSNGRYV